MMRRVGACRAGIGGSGPGPSVQQLQRFMWRPVAYVAASVV